MAREQQTLMAVAARNRDSFRRCGGRQCRLAASEGKHEIGDTVNGASRIETLNKEFRSQMLVSDAVRRAVGCEATALGDVEIRGYNEPMPIWWLA